jgi:hypothetical protein
VLNGSDTMAKTKFCSRVLSATRPAISIERLFAGRVRSIVSLKKRELAMVTSMMQKAHDSDSGRPQRVRRWRQLMQDIVAVD